MSNFNEAMHPRDPAGVSTGGQFTVAPGGGASKAGNSLSKAAKNERDRGGRPTTRAALTELFNRVSEPDGGFSYQPVSDKSPKEGYAVSIYPERSVAFDMKSMGFKDLMHYYVANRDMFRKPGHFLGAWHDPESHKVFLDVSVVRNSIGMARSDALSHDQIAFFDIKAGHSITVNAHAKSGGALP
jgi:hypothetical protein